MKKIIYILTISCMLLSILNCRSEKEVVYQKSQLDKLKIKYFEEPNYSVILKDMDYNESDKKYLHKYQILIEKQETKSTGDSTKLTDVELVETEWLEVSDIAFDKNKENLGMTILSKKNGVLDQKTSPAGYDNYVGNERYGQWKTNSSGESFWSFYGKYYMMTSLFRMGMGGYGYNQWNDYDRNYRGSRRYDGGGRYGTNGRSNTNSSSSWSKKPTSFKDKVNSKVSRSATQSKSRGYSSSSKYSKDNSSSSKTSRNSSRYSGSSSRSRGGGFGK